MSDDAKKSGHFDPTEDPILVVPDLSISPASQDIG